MGTHPLCCWTSYLWPMLGRHAGFQVGPQGPAVSPSVQMAALDPLKGVFPLITAWPVKLGRPSTCRGLTGTHCCDRHVRPHPMLMVLQMTHGSLLCWLHPCRAGAEDAAKTSVPSLLQTILVWTWGCLLSWLLATQLIFFAGCRLAGQQKAHDGQASSLASAPAASCDILPITPAADQHKKERDYIVVEIWDTKWNNRLEGCAYVPLKQLKRRGHMKGKWRLQGGDSPEGRVSEFLCQSINNISGVCRAGQPE